MTSLSPRKRVGLVVEVLLVSFYLVSFASAWKDTHGHHRFWGKRTLHLRAGSSQEGGEEVEPLLDDSLQEDSAQNEMDAAVSLEQNGSSQTPPDEPGILLDAPVQIRPAPEEKRPTKMRRASDLIVELRERSGLDDDDIESHKLRKLVSQRTSDYVVELQDQSKPKIPNPTKLLHFLAPKIPAIKHSPDVALRIQAAPSDMDCGVAACMIGTLGHVCELYDQIAAARSKNEDDPAGEPQGPAAARIVKDRRFEQLVECVSCGVDTQSRSNKEDPNSELNAEHIEEVLEAEEGSVNDGLSIRDACRAAWGLAILEAHRSELKCGVNILELIGALAVRVRHLLLARVRLLREDDLMKDYLKTIDERIEEISEELAEDAASTLWTFACVTACTGTSYTSLFELCCSILLQDPFDMRKRAQDIEATLETLTVGSNDVVERLARSEIVGTIDEDSKNKTALIDRGIGSGSSENTEHDRGDALLDWLSPNEVTDVLWAVALHDGKNETSRTEVNLTDTVEAFCEVAFDRIASWLRTDLDNILRDRHEQECVTGSTTGEAAGHIESAPPEDEESLITQDPVVLDDVSDEEQRRDGGGASVQATDTTTTLASENAESRTSGNIPQLTENVEETEEGRGLEQPIDGEEMVVDAATILASEASDDSIESFETPPNPTATVEEPTVVLHDSGDDVEAREEGEIVVEVVDAATILASEGSDKSGESDEATPPNPTAISEVHDSDATGNAKEFVADASTVLVSESSHNQLPTVGVEQTSEDGQRQPIIPSPRDLSCLAWAVTELHDPLRFQLGDMLTNIFYHMGPGSLKDLSGSGLSNLAWAIAKHKLEDVEAVSEDGSHNLVMSWIADNALGYSDLSESGDPAVSILQRFHPPELSRLVWSITAVLSDRIELGWSTASTDTFVYHALITASSNLSIFGTEDLARIAWAFLAMTDTKQSLHWNNVPHALGRVLTTIETSLSQWESGKLSTSKEDSSSAGNSESTRFASFLGRSRFHVPFQHISDPLDETDEEPQHAKKSGLPLLREIPIDPLTLCKLTSCVAKLGSRHPGFKTDDTLLRIALRLLSSRNGRLLRECPQRDMVRLLEASAVSESPGCRELIGLFSRKALHMINELPHDEFGSVSLNLRSQDCSTFVWSLGRLGVRYMPFLEDKSVAHRRLHLVSKPRLPAPDTLSVSNLLKLLHGLLETKIALRDKSYLSLLLLHIEDRFSSLIQDELDACDLMERLGMLRNAIDDEKPAEVALDVDKNTTTLVEEDGDETSRTQVEKEEEKSTEISMICGRILDSLPAAVVDLLPRFTNRGLLRIITTACQIPFQCDGLMEAIENVINDREKESVKQKAELEEAIEKASSAILSLRDTVVAYDDASSSERALSGVQKGLRAIFRPGSRKSHDQESDSSLATSDDHPPISLEEVEEILIRTVRALDKLKESWEAGSLDGTPDVPEGEIFELSRCREAIEHYRRIDFGEGSRQRSRFDQQRRRDMSKKILSRLLP